MKQKDNEYKHIMDHIEVPDDVWEKTIQKMEAAKQARVHPFSWKQAAAVCAVAILAFLSFQIYQGTRKDPGPVFLSTLKEDGESGYVELKEGILSFDKTTQLTDLQTQTGSITEKQTSLTWDALEKALGKSIELTYVPKDYQLEKKTAYKQSQQLTGELTYRNKDSRIQLQVVQGDSEPTGKRNSQLNGISLYMAMRTHLTQADTKEYYAQFQKDDIQYTLRSEGLPQKEFIRILYFLTK